MDKLALVAALQAAADTVAETTPVEIPQWKMTVHVRKLTIADLEAMPSDASTGSNRIARGLCRVLCDETGARLFDEEDEEDVALLNRQPQEILIKIQSAAGAVDSGKD